MSSEDVDLPAACEPPGSTDHGCSTYVALFGAFYSTTSESLVYFNIVSEQITLTVSQRRPRCQTISDRLYTYLSWLYNQLPYHRFLKDWKDQLVPIQRSKSANKN